MPTTAIVCLHWGDSGKGSMVDREISRERPVYVVRFQGGPNAGHTVVADGVKYVFHQVPSGVLQGVTGVIANGCVVDVSELDNEIGEIEKKGTSIGDNLLISDRAHLILPYERVFDKLWDRGSAGKKKIDTTGRGIGPTYAEKHRRSGLRVCDLFTESGGINKDGFYRKFLDRVAEVNGILSKIYGLDGLKAKEEAEKIFVAAERLKGFVTDTVPILLDAWRRDLYILFEGAQGTLLDPDFGTYPCVTSSHGDILGIPIGTGIPVIPQRRIGVCKAYTTRVGGGPFPTELKGETGNRIREVGGEYGATTGRPRRCGWLDAFAGRYAVWLNDVTELALTKVDVLEGEEVVRFCTGYNIDGKPVQSFPSRIEDLERCEPVYEDCDPWDWTCADGSLHPKIERYIGRIQSYFGKPVKTVTYGPDRNQTFTF